eukprot:scaffold51781_cov59-Phaeocystis_antarctica.AAC.1
MLDREVAEGLLVGVGQGHLPSRKEGIRCGPRCGPDGAGQGGRRRRKRGARGGPDSRLGGQGMRGAHVHVDQGGDEEAQQHVQRQVDAKDQSRLGGRSGLDAAEQVGARDEDGHHVVDEGARDLLGLGVG